MESLQEVLEKIQRDLAEQKESIRNLEHNITTNINQNIDQKFTFMEQKTQELEKQVVQQQKTIDNLERQLKTKNVIFFGVEETEQSYEELQENMLETINNVMKIDCRRSEIENIRRLGPKREKTRPVIVTLTTVGKKINILKNNKTLKESNIYVKPDYPKSVLQKRKDLQEELKKRRELGEQVALRYDKIVTVKRNEAKQNRTQKRELSESPGNADLYKGKNREGSKIYQSRKKNKTYDISSYMQRPTTNIAEENTD